MFHNLNSKWNKKVHTQCRKFHNNIEFCGRSTDSFYNMEITLWYFPQCGKYNLNCENYNVDLIDKWFVFHNAQGEYRAVIALKWIATESCI